MARLALGGVLLVLTSAIALGLVLLLDSQSVPEESTQSNVDSLEGRSEMSAEFPAAARPSSPTSLVVTLTQSVPPSFTSRAHVVDLPTGQVVGTIELGDVPMALLRGSGEELLVSDAPLDGDLHAHPRLQVFSTAQGLQLEWAIPLPDRTGYTVFAQGMALSHDEQFLYYLKRVDCQPGPLCDIWSVGVVDLDARAEIAVASLPRNCGFALLAPLGASGAMAMCPEVSTIFEVTSAGTSSTAAAFTPPRIDQGGAQLPAWPIYGGIADSGTPYMIFQDGTLQMQSVDGTLQLERDLLPQNQLHFNGTARWRLNADRAILGFNEDFGEVMTGALIFDSNRPGMPTLLQLPQGARYLVPTSLGKAAILHQSKISLLDLDSGLETSDPINLPGGSRWLVGSTN